MISWFYSLYQQFPKSRKNILIQFVHKFKMYEKVFYTVLLAIVSLSLSLSLSHTHTHTHTLPTYLSIFSRTFFFNLLHYLNIFFFFFLIFG